MVSFSDFSFCQQTYHTPYSTLSRPIHCAENFNATWSLLVYDDEETGGKSFMCSEQLARSPLRSPILSLILHQPEATLLQEYNRPIYSHVFGLPNKTVWSPNNTKGDIDWLVYTGRRWIHVGFNPDEMNMSFPDIVAATWNYVRPFVLMCLYETRCLMQRSCSVWFIACILEFDVFVYGSRPAIPF